MKMLILFLCPLYLFAQQDLARLEIEKINRRYTALTQLHTEVDYVMYATHTSTKPIDTQRATLSRSGDLYLYKLGPIETLTTPQYSITVDYEDQELIMDKVRKKPSETLIGWDTNTALAACDKVLVSSSSSTVGQTLIRMDLPLPEVEQFDLRFNAATHMLQRVTLYYRDSEEWEDGQGETKARMQIIYHSQNTNPVFAKDLFLLDRFVRKVNGVFVPAPAFKDFTFYNNAHL